MASSSKAPREYKISIMLNEKELRALERFCAQYNVINRSKLIRETLMRTILKQMEKDEPTLFD